MISNDRDTGAEKSRSHVEAVNAVGYRSLSKVRYPVSDATNEMADPPVSAYDAVATDPNTVPAVSAYDELKDCEAQELDTELDANRPEPPPVLGAHDAESAYEAEAIG